MQLLIKKIREIEVILGKPVKLFQNSERPCYDKLGKSLVAAKALQKGEILKLEDIKVKVAEPKGIDASFLKDVVGKTVKRELKQDDSILEEDLE